MLHSLLLGAQSAYALYAGCGLPLFLNVASLVHVSVVLALVASNSAVLFSAWKRSEASPHGSPTRHRAAPASSVEAPPLNGAGHDVDARPSGAEPPQTKVKAA